MSAEGTTVAYSGRVTNWPLVWTMNVLAVALVIGAATGPGAWPALVAVAAVLLIVNATMTSVRTTVGPHGVVVRYGVFGLPRFRYALEDLTHADAVEVSAREMGGWGVHWSPWRGTRLTIRSGPALRLERRKGRAITISAEDPAAAADLVNARVAA